jgi:hypothetical protein
MKGRADMRLTRTFALLTVVMALAACAATPRGTATTMTASPSAGASRKAAVATGEPAAVTIDQLVADPQAYAGQKVIVTATAVREIAPSAWLVGAEEGADSTVLMLNNDLHPVMIGAGDTFEIDATVEQFNDPASMSDEVGALPDMYNSAFSGYQGSYVLVASELSTGA